jgi:hypothetical protein
VLLLDGVAHLLRAPVKMHGLLHLMVQPCSLLRPEGAGSVWRLRDAHFLLQIEDDS